MPEGEASQLASEKLIPRKSILVSVGVGTPELPLVTELSQQVKNIRVEEVMDLTARDKQLDTLIDDLKKKLPTFQHGVLLLHRNDEHGLRSARIAAAMAQQLGAFDIASVDGGWDRIQQKAAYAIKDIYSLSPEMPTQS
jgi:hypothetical protein